MALLELVIYPDPRLRLATKTVAVFDAPLKKLVADMIETMYHNKGVGLAAPQIGVAQKIFVADVSEKQDTPLVFINPTWKKVEGEKSYEEGCLSVPGYYAEVKRPDIITVTAQDTDGKTFEMTADGLLSVCVQHEYDHLQGALFIDYLSRLKQSLLQRKYKKLQKERESTPLVNKTNLSTARPQSRIQ